MQLESLYGVEGDDFRLAIDLQHDTSRSLKAKPAVVDNTLLDAQAQSVPLADSHWGRPG
jgi:hypothetical protein